MYPTHSERVSKHRLSLIEVRDYVGIFEDLDCQRSRITCPLNEDYVLPYYDRSTITGAADDTGAAKITTSGFSSWFAFLAGVCDNALE